MDSLTNQTIRGYLVTDVIGRGPHSIVHRAIQPGVENEVAIKIIQPPYANYPDFIRRFEVEYRPIARLNHLHIATLYDYWRDPDGAYLILRCFSGNLNTLLVNGPLNLEKTAQLIDQITGALTAAHRVGVIHHNLKPNNILIDKNQDIYLADFGIFYDLDDPTLGVLRGSDAYRGPEYEPATIQTDIYGLGVILYQILTGQNPADVVPPMETQRFPSLHEHNPALPLALDAIIQRATAVKPDERYADVIDFADAFQVAITTTGSSTAVYTPSLEQDTMPSADPDIEAAESLASIALEKFIKGSSGIRWRFEREIANPYKGLRPFEEVDAVDFFGREALTEKLIERLKEDHPWGRFLTVVGPSGSGKSSVVKAGMIASLRRGALPGSDQWFIVEMTPKSNPLDEMTVALLSMATHQPPDIMEQLEQDERGLIQVVDAILPEKAEMLLVIDQFEEVFTLTDNFQLVKHFLNLIRTAVTEAQSRIRVIITLRADFYDRPLMYPRFSELVSQRTEVVVPLTLAELERAITIPLERIGIELEAELVPTIVAEVKEQPGVLPMLQYALTELFDRRDGSTLTMDTYRAIGGIRGSLTRRADTVYDRLTSEQQAAARQLFLRLVTLGEGTEDTRRQALRSELVSLHGDVMQEIIAIFGQSRLLTFDHNSTTREPTVEVAHEAIIREWQRLRAWLEKSRSDLRQQRLLATAAREWFLSNQDTSFLAGGSRLDQLESWVETTDLSLSKEETDYVQASIAERNRQRVVEAERQSRENKLEQRAKQRSQILLAVLAISFLLALTLTVFALDAQQVAIKARDVSDEIALLSNSQLALYRDTDTELAIALALEAHKMGTLPDQEFRVLSETMYAPGTRRMVIGHTGRIRSLDLSQDGKQVLSGGEDTTIRLWDVETGKELRQFEGHSGEIMKVIFSPDERLIASAAMDKTVRIWNADTGETLHILEGDKAFMSVDFHPEGHLLATGSQDQSVQLWDVETGELVDTFGPDDPNTETIEGHSGWVMGVTFSPDGKDLLSSGRDNRLLHWDVETGEIVREYTYPDETYKTVFTANGQTFFSLALDNDVHLWDIETGEQRLTLKGHTAAVFDISLSADEKTALTASQDNSIRLWNLETGAEIHRFVGHTGYVYDVEFLPDETQFISSSADSTLRLWDIQTDETLRQLDGHENTIYQVRFNADGTRLLSGSRDKTVRLWDVATGETLHTFGPDDPDTDAIEGHGSSVISVAFSPDSSLILSGELNSKLILWDTETGKIIRIFGPDDPDTETIEGHRLTPENADSLLYLWFVTFSPDGKTAFSTAFDKTIIQWNLETGAVIRQYTGHTDGVLGITFLDDGKRFLTHSWDKSIMLWDTETGEIIRRYLGHENWVWSVALSPDEKTFLSTSADNSMIFWDVETGEPLRYFLGHEDAVLSADFSPDGQWIISSGRDFRVTLWNVQTGEWLRHFGGHTNWVRSVDHSPTEAIFATGDNDGNILLWERQTLDDMVEWAKQNRYLRELTCEERELYRVQPYCDEIRRVKKS